MFTGIVQSVGSIVDLEKKGDWILTVQSTLPLADMDIGGSVAHDGICLTIIEKKYPLYKVQMSGETLSKTTAGSWDVGRKLNLERALRLGDELGGHLLLGHVDGVAKIVSRKDEGESVRFHFEVLEEFARFLAPKGSIGLDGISLTINGVSGNVADVNIIPHTQKMTTIGERKVGDLMNFEVDMMARYIDGLLQKRYGN